jgi:hypothetical protein
LFPTLALVSILALCTAPRAAAEEISLRPRYEPGDSYLLSLAVTTNTQAEGVADASFQEDVHLDYSARVVVLAVDREGRPVRERHEDVRLTFQRPGESGSLFQDGAGYEVRREDALKIFVGDARAEPRIEKIVADVLEKQFEFTLEPALLDPGRPVEVGDTWELDPSVARRFLSTRGMRVAAFGTAEATLAQSGREGDDGGWVINYSIPIERFELMGMPEHARAKESEARLEGQIRLGPPRRRIPISSISNLTLRVSGVTSPPGAAEPVPWNLNRSVMVERRSHRTQ